MGLGPSKQTVAIVRGGDACPMKPIGPLCVFQNVIMKNMKELPSTWGCGYFFPLDTITYLQTRSHFPLIIRLLFIPSMSRAIVPMVLIRYRLFLGKNRR